MRKVIGIVTAAAGVLFLVVGANEADYQTAIGQAGHRWLQYLITGMVLVLIGWATEKGRGRKYDTD